VVHPYDAWVVGAAVEPTEGALETDWLTEVLLGPVPLTIVSITVVR